MNKKIWGIIIIIIGLLIIAVIIYLMFFYKAAAPIAEPEESGNQAAITPVSTETTEKLSTVQPLSPLKKAEVKSDDLARMASAFAERFGSFSNQSDYGNLRDLQIFMTDNMKIWTQNYIADAKAEKTDTSIYYGIVTRSVISEVKQFDGDLGQAEILVKTQRRESTGVAGNSTTFYQDIIIKYLRSGGVWRVDGAYWQDR